MIGKNISFCSEFHADSEYVILFEKYFDKKKWDYHCFLVFCKKYIRSVEN